MQLTIDHKYLLLTSLITIVETISLFPPCQFWEQEYFNVQRKLNFGTVGGGGGRYNESGEKKGYFQPGMFSFSHFRSVKIN